MIGDKDNPITVGLSRYIRGADGGVISLTGKSADQAGITDGSDVVIVRRELWDKLVEEITDLRQIEHEMDEAEKSKTMPEAQEKLDLMFIKMSIERSPQLVEKFVLAGFEPDSQDPPRSYSQLVDGKWWWPRHGIDSLANVINAMRKGLCQ